MPKDLTRINGEDQQSMISSFTATHLPGLPTTFQLHPYSSHPDNRPLRPAKTAFPKLTCWIVIMAGGEDHGGSHSRELDQTPTWAVAAVVAVIIILSIGLEKFLEKVGEWFKKRRKSALYEALEKVKGGQNSTWILN
ncbi:hypothetical protein ACLOJK_018366 [Asimina triloba]